MQLKNCNKSSVEYARKCVMDFRPYSMCAIIHGMKKAVYFFVIFLIILTASRSVFALTKNSVGGNKSEIDDLKQQMEEKKKKIEMIEKSIEEYKSRIKQTQLEAVSLNNQMSIINNRVAEVQLDIKATEEKLSNVSLEIEALKLGIKDKENVIMRQKQILSGLVRNLYMQDDKNIIEIAAAYESFSDFYNRIQYLETVESSLGSSVRAISDAKTDLESKKEQVEERKEAYENFNDKLKDKKTNLNEQLYLKKDLFTQTKNSEKKFNTLLSSLRSQYQAIEGDIVSMEKQIRQKLEEQSKLEKLGNKPGMLAWPTPSHSITSVFHDPDYPYRHVFEHNGIDIKAGQGTAIRASAPGYVGRAKFCSSSSCYSYVMIIHVDGLATVYGHLSRINVQEEQFVTRGDVIGYSGGMPGTVGAGPFVTGPHLHFEVRKSGIPVDPLGYLQ